MDNNDIIKQIKNSIRNIISEGKCILYGSRARGDFKKDSDVDLMILLPDKYKDDKFSEIESKVTETLYNLELHWDMQIEISPVILRESVFFARKTPFTLNVLNEGIEL